MSTDSPDPKPLSETDVASPLDAPPRTSPDTTTSPPEGELSPTMFLHVFRRWSKVVIPLALLLAVGAGTLVYITFEPTYEATAWIRFDESTSLLDDSTEGHSRQFDYVQTQIELIRSPVVLGTVVEQLRPEILPADKPEDQLIRGLAKELDVLPLGRSELLKISLESRDAEKSERIVNATVDAYFDFIVGAGSGRAQRVIELLEEAKARREEDIRKLRRELGELLKESPGLELTMPGMTAARGPQNSLLDLQTRLATIEGEQEVLNARIQALEESIENDSVTVPAGRLSQTVESQPEVQRLKEALAEKQTKLVAIESASVRGADDPFYGHLERQIEYDKEMLAKIRSRLREELAEQLKVEIVNQRQHELDQLRMQYEGNRRLHQALRESYEKEMDSTSDPSGGSLELHAKQNELARAEEVLAEITTRLSKLSTEQNAPSKATLLRRASVPTVPVEAFPLKTIALASFVVFCLPLGLLFLSEYFMPRVATAKELEQGCGLPVLAETPRLAKSRGVPLPGVASRRPRRSREAFEEALDGLSALIQGSPRFDTVATLAVSSASTGEGKTSVCVQLAASLARSDEGPVLLVDGDMRSPDVHGILGISQSPGLAEVLAGRSTPEEAIVELHECFHVLPAGKLTASPRRLCREQQFRKVLDTLRPRYRHIVVDAPPVLAASETTALLRAVDGCLLCVMRDASVYQRINAARKRLAASGIGPTGLVFNGVPLGGYQSRYGTYRYVNRDRDRR